MITTQIDRDAISLLRILAATPRNEYVDREEVARRSGLPPDRVNDGVALLVNSGYAEWIQTFGTAPYDFNAVTITSRGRYEAQRLAATREQPPARNEPAPPESQGKGNDADDAVSTMAPILPPSPIGSPYGFTDADWELVAARKNESGRLYVVLAVRGETRFYAGCHADG